MSSLTVISTMGVRPLRRGVPSNSIHRFVQTIHERGLATQRPLLTSGVLSLRGYPSRHASRVKRGSYCATISSTTSQSPSPTAVAGAVIRPSSQLAPSVDYQALFFEMHRIIPKNRLFNDPLHTLAYGTDASFYRMIPQIVVLVDSEDEIRQLLALTRKYKAPVTFRAAGTSLSGQAVTDSVLLKLTEKGWTDFASSSDGKYITVGPGMIGGKVNKLLQKHARKIGPDPSSIDSCMIGGIVSNNSSGMCCGVSQNTYHTIEDIRVVLADGTVLDTSDPESVDAFRQSHNHLLTSLSSLATQVKNDPTISALIHKKFKIKCTTGYSLNALVDYEDPIEILKHLMVGSEGTLAFISRVVMATVPNFPHKATSLMLFNSLELASQVVHVLQLSCPVEACELLDSSSLISAQSQLESLGFSVGEAALLIETRAESDAGLTNNIQVITDAIMKHCSESITKPSFVSGDAAEKLWDIRRGLIPMIGSNRPSGSSMLIEDVAVETSKLAALVMDLQAMFRKHEYHDNVIFGHALDGNLHLVFSQKFSSDKEIKRFSAMMEDLCTIVAVKHGGSLKAEHGTGRNIAPFVEMEWGRACTDIMWTIKTLFDPEFLINPGVILNKDAQIHTKNLKPSPSLLNFPANRTSSSSNDRDIATDAADRCIECGFCESVCPSRNVTLTPRQRIASLREIYRLEKCGDNSERLQQMTLAYDNAGVATCAADGMCATKCPVSINTGDVIKQMRQQRLEGVVVPGMKSWGLVNVSFANMIADVIADNFRFTSQLFRRSLGLLDMIGSLVGSSSTHHMMSSLRSVSFNRLPEWNSSYPSAASPLKLDQIVNKGTTDSTCNIVYFPTCVSRMMGPTPSDSASCQSLPQVMASLTRKANIGVSLPDNIDSLCCGLAFASKGFNSQANRILSHTESKLKLAISQNNVKIVVDASPCTQHLKKNLKDERLRAAIVDSVEFAHDNLLTTLNITSHRQPVAVHVPCSGKSLSDKYHALAKACSGVDPYITDVACCGTAGERGLVYPELPSSALWRLKQDIASRNDGGIQRGYCGSRTCEISLSNKGGIPFRSILYLIDETSVSKPNVKL